MSRAIRRAVTRQAAKLAAKAMRLSQQQQQQPLVVNNRSLKAEPEMEKIMQQPETVETETTETTETADPRALHENIRRLSDAQLAANRLNAQKSTGPKSAEGKTKVSMNAVRTGMTGRAVLLPTDDVVAYQAHIARHVSEFVPITPREETLVQFIADAEWRLLRIVPLEASVEAAGRLTCAHLVADETDSVKREALLQGHIFLVYRREFNNISLTERRLRNQLKADIAELQALQADRVKKKRERATARISEVDRAARLLVDAEEQNIPVNDLREFGFDFTSEEMLAFRRKNIVFHTLTRGRNLNFDQFLAAFRAENPEEKAETEKQTA
jgi:hypothetical protein